MANNSLYFEYKMRSKLFNLLFNVFLGIAVYLGAELGRLQGIQNQPLSISVVWPSTGFSLAALLLFGVNAWPGIFFGNFVYNFSHLFVNSHEILIPLSSALLVSLGSLCQAFLGFFILRAFTTKGYFNTVKDIIIFLIPGGILTCMIASTVGVTALFFFYKTVTAENFFNTWLTFWIGDSMGVYIFTPLLVVWSISRKPSLEIGRYFWEGVSIVVGFAAVTFLSLSFPLAFLYIPLSVWTAYRFGMRGATLAIFLIAMVTIIRTSMGYGALYKYLMHDTILFLVIFLEIIVAITLIIAAFSNERAAALQQVQNYNIDLQQAVEMHMEQLKYMGNEIFIKKRLASLGLLTSGIAREIQIPLKRINIFIKDSINSLNELKILFALQKGAFEKDIASKFQNNLEVLENQISNIAKIETQVNRLAEIIEDQSVLTSPGLMKVKPVDIKTLLKNCLRKIMFEEAANDFPINLTEDYDKNAQMILALPEDLTHAFLYILNNSVLSMKKKKNLLGDNYIPQFRVMTNDRDDKIEVEIRDNGSGFTQQQQKTLFLSYTDNIPSKEGLGILEEKTRLPLIIAHDIITHIYHGEIKVSSKEGEYLKMTIHFPRENSS